MNEPEGIDWTEVGGIVSAIVLSAMFIFLVWGAIGGQAYCQKQTQPSWLCEDPKAQTIQPSRIDYAPTEDPLNTLMIQCYSGIDLYGLCGMFTGENP